MDRTQLSEFQVNGQWMPMSNKYILYRQTDEPVLYCFDINNNLVQTVYGSDLYKYTYPIYIQGYTYPYTYLTIGQLAQAINEQYLHGQYMNIQQDEIYESIQVDGNPNIYILKQNDTPLKTHQEVTVVGYVDLYAYDKVHKGNKITVDYDVRIPADASLDVKMDLIKMSAFQHTPWLEDLFWDYEEIPDYVDNYYIGILITDSVSSVLQQYTLNNPRIVEKVDGVKPVSQLKGQTFRTALFNKHFEVYSDMNDYYIEVLQNCEQTTVGKCYEIVYNDLGITNIPEKQDINDLMNLIYDNQEKLNYYIYNPITNTIPAKARYNRQVYISEYYNHIFISQKNQNLFIKSDQLAKKIYNIQTNCQNVYDMYDMNTIQAYIAAHIQCIKSKQQCQQYYIIIHPQIDDDNCWDKLFKDIYDQYIANKIIPYYENGKLYVAGTLFYRKREDTITKILSMFQRSDISVDYKFHEKLYSKGIYNKNYMKIDFNRCYSHALDKEELPQIQRIKTITKFAGQTVRSYNYYLIQNIQHPLIPCNIIHGRNLLKLEKYLNIDLHKYIISEIEVEKHYDNIFSYKQYDKKSINIAIGCMFKSKTETRYKISPTDYVQLMNNIRYNYQFLHCQVINNKISLMLYALQEMNVKWDDILEIHTDAITIPINNTWNTLTYADDTQMFKQEEYDMSTCCLKQYDVQFPRKYKLNVQLIQAFAGSGKTFHIKTCLKQFRNNQFRCKDDKILVLVCKNLNIEQYKEYRDVATIQSYQGIDFQNNYKQILNFQAIYLDEVYLMDAQFVQKLYSFLQSSEYKGQLVLVGDYYQQCNLNCKKSDYYFLSDIDNIEYLKQNWRNDINYKQFIKDKQFDSQLMIQYCKDNNLLFDPNTITMNDIDPNAVYICKTNETSCKICSMYNFKFFGNSPLFTPEQEQQAMLINVSTSKPSDSKKITYEEYVTTHGNQQQNIFDCSHKIIHSWYGNGITCYKSQGMQWKKIYIDNTITSASQLYVAISRLVKEIKVQQVK